MADSAIVGILRALLTMDTAEFDRGIKRAQTGLQHFSRESKTVGLQATQLGTQLTKTLTLPLAAVGVSVAKAAIDFETSFAGIRKTVNASEAEFAAIAQQMRGLAKAIPVNVNELNKLGEAAGALGIQKTAIVDFSRVMALLGVTTNVASEQAVESIAQIQTVFQATGIDTERFASTLVDLGNKGASTEAQILELANRIASAGRAVGMSQAAVLGFSSAIANVGIDAEAGGTAISRVFGDMSMAVSKGGEDVEAFAVIAGKGVEEFAKLFKDDAAAAVTSFIEGLGKAHKAGGDLNLILDELGFKEVRQARALRDLALSGDNLSKSLRVANTAWRENTALSEEARKRFETTASQITLLWNRVKDLGITLGNALLPMIKSVVSALDTLVPLAEKGAAAFAKMPVPVQAVAVALGLTLAAAGPLIFIFGQLALSSAAVSAAFTKKGIATRGLTALLGGLNTTVVATTTAFRASAVAVGLFTAALAGIVVPLALMKIAEVIEHLRGLLKDSQQWRLNAVEENAAHLNMMAEASKVAGREVTNLAEAQSILKGRIATLQMAQERGLTTTNGLTILTDLYGKSQGAAANATTTYQRALKSLQGDLAAAQKQLAGLTRTQRDEIAAGIELGHSNKEIADSLNKAFPALKLTEAAVGMLRDALSGAESASKKFAKSQKEMAEDIVEANREWLDILGEIESKQMQRDSDTRRADIMADFEAQLRGIESTVDAAFEAADQKERIEAEYRQFMNEQGERMMQNDRARMEAMKAYRERYLVQFTQSLMNVGEAATSGLFSMFFGGDDGGRAKQAKEEYEQLKRSGTASAEAITRAFRAMKEEQGSFFDRFKGWTSGILREFKRMIDELLGMWIREFLGGMIRAIMRSKVGQALTNFLIGSIPGLGAGAGGGGGGGFIESAAKWGLGKLLGGGGVATTGFSSGAGGTLAASMIAPSVASTAVPVAIASQGASAGIAGGAAAGAGGGGGAAGGSFLTNPAFYTNPYTLAVVGGIALAVAVWKKGLFRGGEEALHVNKPRDEFIQSKGGNTALGNSLLQTFMAQGMSYEEAEKRRIVLIDKTLNRADTRKEFEAATDLIDGALNGNTDVLKRIETLLARQGRVATGPVSWNRMGKDGTVPSGPWQTLPNPYLSPRGQDWRGIKSYQFGGFVPPNITMPAILHGGSHGEAIVPMKDIAEGQFTRGARIEIHNHISAIDSRGVKEFVGSKSFTDSMSRAFEDNHNFITSRTKRAFAP